MTTQHVHPEQEALFLLAPSVEPAAAAAPSRRRRQAGNGVAPRFRLDDTTVELGRQHIARIRAEIAERRAIAALDQGIAPERAQLGARSRRRRAA